jgi:GH18 family chitinase
MDRKNLVALLKELHPLLLQDGKTLVLYVSTDYMALYQGTHFNLKSCEATYELFLGFDLPQLVNFVDYLYFRTTGYNGGWSNTVQSDTTLSNFVR